MKKAVIALLSMSLCGCAAFSSFEPGSSYCEVAAEDLLQANHTAVDQLLASMLPNKGFIKSQPIIVATLVNIDDLTSSRLGRVLSEQIGTKLTKSGYSVIELKLRGNIFVKQSEGEFLLSREVKDISLNHKAQAVVVGTYAESRGYVYVTVKIVSANDNQTIAAHDYALPLDANIRSLLWTAGK
ncbi:MAG: hypothetical protein FD174_1090 [Geobacteraceae bacterium]|nr:MAG: hypothetical protein FD174_1090 [Geobacteraceae bacterium]